MSKRNKKPSAPKAKITFRHNFLPVILGLGMFISVLALQNSQWIVAQAEYHFSPRVSAAAINSEAYAAAPADSLNLSVPSIGVTAPVIYESSMADWRIQIDLRSGVVHLGPTAVPGQKGNVVIVGHSSQVPWAPGSYKFVFTLLDKVKQGDLITLDYHGVRYIYRVYGSEVIDPTNFGVIQPTPTPELTLITCTPVGTSKYRLVVHARQVSPNPNAAISLPNQTPTTGLQKLPQ